MPDPASITSMFDRALPTTVRGFDGGKRNEYAQLASSAGLSTNQIETDIAHAFGQRTLGTPSVHAAVLASAIRKD